MKYIITEEQNERIVSQVLDYLDYNLTPFNGWESPEEYQKGLESTFGELFLFLEDFQTGDDKHMWYSIYDNPNLSGIEEEDCPLVLIPDEDYNSLTGYFGDYWKPIFKKWFKKNTKLPLKTVDEFGWTNSNR